MSVSYIKSAGNRDFISDFRDFKLRLIKSDINFTINQKALIKYNNELIFISKKFSNDIITGSLALSLFGLIKVKKRLKFC